MEITIEIPEEEAPFVMKLLKSFKFLQIKKKNSQKSVDNFKDQWNLLSARLPQSDPQIDDDEIAAEIEAVRAIRAKRGL